MHKPGDERAVTARHYALHAAGAGKPVRFTDCDLTGVTIRDGWLVNASISGYLSNVTVNDVDVAGFVSAELDRRHPERVQFRECRTADDSLGRLCQRTPAPGYPDEERAVITGRPSGRSRRQAGGQRPSGLPISHS